MVRLLVAAGLFAGESLADELAFIRHFHHHPRNLLLHHLGFPLTLLGALVLASSVSIAGVPGHVVLAVLYTLGFLALDRLVGLGYALVFVLLGGAVSWIRARGGGWPIGLGLLLTGGATQVLGHVIYERALPAFRAFEALFTTPFYLLLTIYMRLGYRPGLEREIEALRPRWAGAGRRLG